VSEVISTVWFSPGRRYYVGGSGMSSPIYMKRSLHDPTWLNESIAALRYYVYSMRGTRTNDVFTCGGFGEVGHFNGMSWISYRAVTAVNGNYYSVACRGDLTVAVGYDYPRAIVAIGRR
jgi:hypothetical protein